MNKNKLSLAPKSETIASTLTTAVLTLYGAQGFTEVGEAETWSFDGDFLYYKEAGRLQILQSTFKGTYFIDTNETIGFKALGDILTGASPNGQIVSLENITITSPSGKGDVIRPNSLPVLPDYKELRVAGAVSYGYEDSNASYSVTASGSRELDYISLGLSTSISIPFNQKNTTFDLGVSINNDTIISELFTPKPLVIQKVLAAISEQPILSRTQKKEVFDFLIGFSQIVDTSSFITFLYSYGNQQGYLTDPYKVISIVEENTGRLLKHSPEHAVVIYESRPDSKITQSVYLGYKKAVGKGVFSFGIRALENSWGIKSSTFDTDIIIYLNDTIWIKPHIRYYQQGSADFYRPFLSENQLQSIQGCLQCYASADYRIGKFTATTLGLELGFDEDKFSIGIETYQQAISEPKNKFGELRKVKLVPDLSTILIRVNFKLD